MYAGYKIITVTPAGRKKYLKILHLYLLKNRHIIDKHRFWVNTKNNDDIDFMKSLCRQYPDFYELEFISTDEFSNLTIHNFFKNCIDDDTIYIRFDDDICYIKEDAIENLLKFRISNPDYFIVYPLIVNNCYITNILQKYNILTDKYGVAGSDRMGHGWSDSNIVRTLHEDFLTNYLDNNLSIYNLDDHVISDYNIVSINCFCWMGKGFKKFDGKVGIDEETWIGKDKPYQTFKHNAICGSALVVHFAFYIQRQYLENETFLLEYYQALALDNLNKINFDKKINDKNYLRYENLTDNKVVIEDFIERNFEEIKFYQTNNTNVYKFLNTTCIFIVEVDSEYRTKHLLFNLKHLKKYFKMNFIIVELYENYPKLNSLIDNNEYISIKEKFANRNKILNKIYDTIDSEIIINFECDFYVFPPDLYESIIQISNGNYNFAIPYRLGLFLNENCSNFVEENENVPNLTKLIYENEPQLEILINNELPFKITEHVGLCWIFKKNIYQKYKYENTNFIGHGFEDCERILRVSKFGEDIFRPKHGIGRHLWHPRINSNFYSNLNSAHNYQKMIEVSNMNLEELKEHIASWSYILN
jgi:hypothetical protein